MKKKTIGRLVGRQIKFELEESSMMLQTNENDKAGWDQRLQVAR